MNQQTYPAQITATKRVTRKTDKNGNKYISARMMVGTTKPGQEPVERTVRVFGPLAAKAVSMLKKGVAVPARVAYDSFTGEGGRGQTVRIVSLAAAA